MADVQIWFSYIQNIDITKNGVTLIAASDFTPIGNKVNNRVLNRAIISSLNIAKFCQLLTMYGGVPFILAVQNSDGTDFDAVHYPKNVIEFNKHMTPINYVANGITYSPTPTNNTAGGWAPFQS